MPRPIPIFHDMVGQRHLVNRIKRKAANAKAMRRSFPPGAFIGPCGVGKTLLANSLAHEIGGELWKVICDEQFNEVSWAQRAATWKAFDVILLDEFHRLLPYQQEIIFSTIDEGMVPKLVVPADGKKPRVEGTVEAPPVTILIATNYPGKILPALRSRLGLPYEFRPYTNAEMRCIVRSIASRMGLDLGSHTLSPLVGVSRRNPRFSENILKEALFQIPRAAERTLTKPMVNWLLRALRFDQHGMLPTERRYLALLDEVDPQPVTLRFLAARLNTDPMDVDRRIEPYLLERGWVTVAPRGRTLTPVGRELVQNFKHQHQEKTT